MNIETIKVLYDLMKNEKYTASSAVKIRKEYFDDSKEVFCFILPIKNRGEQYNLEFYNKKSYIIFLFCQNGCSVQEIVWNLSKTKDSTDDAVKVFLFVIRVIRDFQMKGILI